MAIGSIVAGISALAGGVLSSKSNRKANAANAANSQLDRDMQREFAQQGIRWRVEDAQAAGIHPLYAMGASLPTYSPSAISVGSTNSGAGLAAAGQNIGRAIDATRDPKQRASARLTALQLERGELENDLLRSQIVRLNAPQTGPAFPTATSAPQNLLPGQGDSGILPELAPNVAVQGTRPSQRAGAQPEIMWVKTKRGYQAVPAQEAYEDADIGSIPAWPWFFRNSFLPNMHAGKSGFGNPPPLSFLPRGQGYTRWRFSRAGQEWVPERGTIRRSRATPDIPIPR